MSDDYMRFTIFSSYVNHSGNLAVTTTLSFPGVTMEERMRGWRWELREFILDLMGCFYNAYMSESLQEREGNSQQIVKDKIQSNDTKY